jgi:hypothetical protein
MYIERKYFGVGIFTDFDIIDGAVPNPEMGSFEPELHTSQA